MAVLTVIIRRFYAPCSTCDGTLIARDWKALFAWCRCRRRWSEWNLCASMCLAEDEGGTRGVVYRPIL